jgi:hypothetical protein
MARVSIVVIALSGAITLLFTILFAPGSVGYVVAASVLLLAIAFSGLDPVRLVCACFALSIMAHTLKRAIFLAGDQPRGAYYAIVATPIVLAAILTLLLWPKRRFHFPTSGVFLIAFIAVAVANTLVRSRQFGAAAGLFQYIGASVFYFAGLCLPDRALKPLAKTCFRVGLASLAYGLWQFLSGPTLVDIAWANRASDFSGLANRVLSQINPSSDLYSDRLFRPYGLHSDTFAWGLSLVTLVVMAAISETRRRSQLRFPVAASLIAIAGLGIGLSRSPIAGFLACTIFAFAAYRKWLKSPILMVAALSVASVLIVTVGQYLTSRFVNLDESRQQDTIAARYLQVGTISARTNAGAQFLTALSENPIFGQGLEASAAGTSKGGDVDPDELALSHNIAVDLIFVSGGLGALCFFGFIYHFFGEVLALRRSSNDPLAVAVSCWIFGAVGGFLITGFLSGAAFLNSDFFLLMGIGAGWAARRKLQQRPRPVIIKRAEPIGALARI